MTKKIIFDIVNKYFSNFFYKKISYSQDGEDMVLASFFEEKKFYKGFYVDVGAHHPYRFSNTAYFYKKGWKGINIEPTPSLYKSFPKLRKRDINLNIGTGKGDILTFYIFNDGALNTFDKELAEQRHNDTSNKYFIIKTIQIKTFKLNEILDQYIAENQVIDFLTIDVEGLDFDVLKSNNWNKYRPLFLLVECDTSLLNINNDQINIFLIENGYEIVARTQRTSIFKLKQ